MKCLHNVITFITLYIWMQVLLLEALKANRCDYVRVLLDRGVHLKMINLPELYEQVNVCTIIEFLKHFFQILIYFHGFIFSSRPFPARNVSSKEKIVFTCSGY